MRRASKAAWWIIEVGLPAGGVFSGVLLLFVAAAALVTGALHEAARMRVFLTGLAFWVGGILWGAFVNDGIALRRWLAAR